MFRFIIVGLLIASSSPLFAKNGKAFVGAYHLKKPANIHFHGSITQLSSLELQITSDGGISGSCGITWIEKGQISGSSSGPVTGRIRYFRKKFILKAIIYSAPDNLPPADDMVYFGFGDLKGDLYLKKHPRRGIIRATLYTGRDVVTLTLVG